MVLAVSCKKSSGPGPEKPFPEPEPVDLGIVMERVDGTTYKLLWGSFNLGASREYEYGDYYAWGELTPKSDYSWETYALANGDYEKLTSYCAKDKERFWDKEAKPEGPDGVMRLALSDDAANYRLGGKWRMPTLEEIRALLALKAIADDEDSDYKWDQWVSVTNDDGEEVFGTRITRKSTEATLFIPATGRCEGTDSIVDAGTSGGFWSATLNPSAPTFTNILFTNSNITNVAGLNRQKGFPVRPVREK